VERQGQTLIWRAEHPYSCPRCRKKGALMLGAEQPECAGCGLPLVAGPNGRLYAAHELEALDARSKATRHAMERAERADRARVLSPRLTRVLVGGAIATILLMAGGTFAFWRSPPAAHAQATTLTRQCLDGDWQTAISSVGDDDLQRAEFRRWQIMHFASIQAKVRPAGDRVRLDVTDIQSSNELRVLRVTMTSPFMGERSHAQYWNRTSDGNWRFDAVTSFQDPLDAG
jgi:hypothetical protein